MTKSPITLEEVQASQESFDRAHAGAEAFFETITADNLPALEHLVVCIAGEVGELANVVKKVRRGDVSFDEARASIIDEAADVFIYLVKLANQCGFRLDDAFIDKLARNKERFRRYER